MLLYLDIKNANKTMATGIIKLIEKYKLENTVLVASINFPFLSYIQFTNPDIRVILEGYNAGKEIVHHFIPKNFKPDYYSSSILRIDKKHVDFLEDNDLIKRRIVFAVNKSNINKIFDLGIQHIILDYDSTMQDVEVLKKKLLKNKRH